MAESGIYEIVNLVNGKRYVGSAVDKDLRWRQHRNALRRGDHPNVHLQRAWAKDGEQSFVFRMIEVCEPAQLIEREQVHIDARADYNICPNAGSSLGRRHSEGTRAKISEKKRGQKMAPRTDEHRANISKALRGKSMNPSSIAKMAETKRGSTLPPEHRAKIGAGLKAAWADGKREREKSPEWRAKIADTLRGGKLSVEHRKAVSEAMRGKKRGPYNISDEERRARSERAKANAAKMNAARWGKPYPD